MPTSSTARYVTAACRRNSSPTHRASTIPQIPSSAKIFTGAGSVGSIVIFDKLRDKGKNRTTPRRKCARRRRRSRGATVLCSCRHQVRDMARLFTRVCIVAALCIGILAIAVWPARAGTTGTIEGYVSDAGGHRLAGVTVTAASPSGRFLTTTGSNGFYAVNGLPLDTYTVTFSRDGYQTTSVTGVTTVQDQPNRLSIRLEESSVKSLGHITVRGTTSLVQPTVTANTYVVNQQRLSDINGTPQDLNGFQAFNSLPGVTTDNFGYPVIRAGAENDVGYELDGVDNTDAVTGQFLNAVSLNGARSVQLSTGGYDVSNGNTNSGVINEVIQRGTYPAAGQATFRVTSP